MKLRIRGNSMRLRVSRSELARLLNGERLEDIIHFSPSAEAHLTYRLQVIPQLRPVRIDWTPQCVTVLVSDSRAKLWRQEAEVGIYGSINIGAYGTLELSIEKDFACLDRSDEENADTFANPNSAAICK